MTVGQTIAFATAVKTPADAMRNRRSKKEWRNRMTDFLLRSMGIAHTKDTKLGNEYIRGVSGGERKRVSIIEVLATKASVFCWDNSTRGKQRLWLFFSLSYVAPQAWTPVQLSSGLKP